MPKMILEFNLPEEQEDANVAFLGKNLYLTLFTLDEFLRRKWEYNDDNPIRPSEIRDKLLQIMQEYNLNLDLMS